MVSYNDANRDNRWPTIHPDDVPTCVSCGGQIEHPIKLFSEVPDNGLCECSDPKIGD